MKKMLWIFIVLNLICANQTHASVEALTNALQTLKAKLIELTKTLEFKERKDKDTNLTESDPLFALINKIFEVRKNHAKDLLEPLSERVQAAGVDNAEKYYDSSILDQSGPRRISLRNLHNEGNDKMTNEELQQIFFLGMFQFYTNECSNFNMNINYLQIITDLQNKKTQSFEREKPNLWGLLIRFGISAKGADAWWGSPKAKPFIATLQKATASFKKNISLAILGGAFQQWKVVVEKIKKPLITTDRYSDLLKIDRITTDLQIMIYHWMKQGYEKFAHDYKKNQTETGEFLVTFEPDFLNHPYYKEIMSKLNTLTKPVTAIADITIKSK